MKAENRKYKVTYFDGSKKTIIGTHNLPPQSQVRSIRLIKEPTSVSAIHRVREDQPSTSQTVSDYLCFADFEYTCGGMSSDISFDAAYGQEILSVGIVVASRQSGEIADPFYRTIRPAHNQVLTGFCKKLTGLTQEEIDASDSFETVMKEAAAFCQQYDFQEIFTFGNGDRQILLKDQKRHLPVPKLNGFIAQLKSVDSYLSNLLFRSSLPISLANLKELCHLDGPVLHHALADAHDLCAVWFCVTGGNYDKVLAKAYQSERINKAEYYRNRQFLSMRSPAKQSIDNGEKETQEKAITSALEVIAYLNDLNARQPFVQDIKLTAFCDDLLALLGAPEEYFAVQKRKKE